MNPSIKKDAATLGEAAQYNTLYNTRERQTNDLERAFDLLMTKVSAEDYRVWFECGCALKKLGGTYEQFRTWSKTSKKFSEDNCKSQWDALPDEPKAGFGTIHHYATGGGKSVTNWLQFRASPDEMMPMPQNDEERRAQLARFLLNTFKANDFFEVCTGVEISGRMAPARSLAFSGLSDEDTIESLQNEQSVSVWLSFENGGYISTNPLEKYDEGKWVQNHPDEKLPKASNDDMVTDFRFVLLECDEMPVDEQWRILKTMRLPVASVVHSGGKSLHVLVRIDAGKDRKLFNERVAKLFAYAARHGYKADTACRNPMRLTRLPGCMRGDKLQYAVSWSWGYPDWASFERGELNSAELADHDSNAFEREKKLNELEEIYGAPFSLSEKGAIKGLNHSYFAAYISYENNLQFADGEMWKYDRKDGVWKKLQSSEMNNLIVATLHKFTTERMNMDVSSMFSNKRTCDSIYSFMKDAADNPFVKRDKSVVHVANGMLRVSKDGVSPLMPFAPDFYSRNSTGIKYDPEATCPRFMNQLLGRMCDEDDMKLIQLYCGQCLLGHNFTQTILVITGTAGSGKGTIVRIIDKINGGEANSVELRTNMLGSRFETHRFIGKTLLLGQDVNSNFLFNSSASHLKSLCGGDRLSAEAKGKNGDIAIYGNFNMIITANDRLLLNIDGDVDAWRRRILWVEITAPEVTDGVVRYLDEKLIAEEGPGILNWMLQGAVELMADSTRMRTLAKRRINKLLKESDSVYGFLTSMVEPTKNGMDTITSQNLYHAYLRYCAKNDCLELPERTAKLRFRRGMLSVYHIARSNDIKSVYGDYVTDVRGYRGVRIREKPLVLPDDGIDKPEEEPANAEPIEHTASVPQPECINAELF